MEISRLQYITNYQSGLSHLDQVKALVGTGVNWIQYRPKYSNKLNVLSEGKEIREICEQNNILFIMNDSPELAIELKADGVHLGKTDMSPEKAREIIGQDKIIGGTANTINDVINLVNLGVDYIGLGPFRYTKTKENLSPFLGLDGYKEICNRLDLKQINIPIIAIGGILEEDVNSLMSTGIHGIAVSSVLSEATDINDKAKSLLTNFK